MIETHPLVDGEPFPTLFWLTCRRASAAIGGLESAGVMRELTKRIQDEPDLAAALQAADADYRARRDEHHKLEATGGIGGAGPHRVKCLHAHYAHELVCHCNPIGAWTADQIGDVHHPPSCV